MMIGIEKTWNEMDRRIEDVLLSRNSGPIQGNAHLEPLRDFCHLVRQAVAIRDCGASWEVKHEILFDVILPAVSKTRLMLQDLRGQGIHGKEWAEKLVTNHVEALEKRAADIRMILDAIDSMPYGGEDIKSRLLKRHLAMRLSRN